MLTATFLGFKCDDGSPDLTLHNYSLKAGMKVDVIPRANQRLPWECVEFDTVFRTNELSFHNLSFNKEDFL